MTLRSVCISVGAVLAFLCCGAMPVSASTSINQLGSDIDGEAEGDQLGRSVSLSSDGTILAIGANLNDGNGSDAGHVRVYEWNGSAWIQKGADIDGEAEGDQLGRSVSLSSDGTILAIGANLNDGNGSDAGHVRVYEWNGSAWVQKGGDIDGEAAGDYSGYSVSLSSGGTILAIGANRNDGAAYNAGHVRVYRWNGSAWVQKGSDIDGEAERDYSGRLVSLSSDGNVVAIGAYLNDGAANNAGHVRVYEWNGTAWVQMGADIDGEAEGDNSGYSVSLSSDGTILAIAARYNDGNGTDSGHVRVYEWNGSAWQQKGADIDGEAASDYSGVSLSLSSDGTILAIGATRNDGNGSDAGHVRVYEWNGSAWVQKGVDIDGEAEGDFSGAFLSLSSDGTILAISGLLNDGNGSAAGHVRVYSISPDADGDGVGDGTDNCPASSNADQTDTDSDGTGDACDTDDDGDGVLDGADNCPLVSNVAQTDTDSDGTGDTCDTDDDGDGVLDGADNCPLISNADQTDTDANGTGDACDTDDDGDGVLDGADNCPLTSNADQTDTDSNGTGNACDTDNDGDGILDGADNCPLTSNADQTDTDANGTGDACDTDDDGDGVLDGTDNCPLISNADQSDTDANGTGDACDTDDDGDGVLDGADNCPLISNADQTDTDANGTGDACDTDDDGDGVLDGADNCPLTSNADQTDTDSNGTGNACDTDNDGDGILDGADNCPLTSNADQTDTDANGTGDACDTDDDGDGVLDVDEVREDCRIKVDCDSDGETDLTDPFPLAITEVSLGTGESIKTVPPDRLSTCSLNQSAAYVSPYTAPEGMESIDTQLNFSLTGCDTDSPETISVKVDFGKALPAEGLVCKVEGTSEPVDMTDATINGTAVTYTLTDNGQFDANPTAGVIDDPVTVVTVIVPAAVPVPIRSLWLLLVGLLIPAMAWRKHHAKRVNQWL